MKSAITGVVSSCTSFHHSENCLVIHISQSGFKKKNGKKPTTLTKGISIWYPLGFKSEKAEMIVQWKMEYSYALFKYSRLHSWKFH